MSLGYFALARSIKPAAAFFEVAGEVGERGVEVEQCDGHQKVVGLREGYQPSDEWQQAVFAFYCAVSSSVRYALEDTDHEGFDSGEVQAWREAFRGGRFEPWGWVHRVIQLMNHARRINNAPTDMGDPEFDLMARVIQQKIEERLK
ncbi:hypothetical protein [Vreelandella alkaliphila]|uniref:Uncharacterized protein n=1 Tax=Vreelandella alkaliphila TaxID=272774 RepID=A0AAJ2VQH6_9GAMM|nr:hypothetical protein [Halomonas alkaliphila]MDX5979557.1 hypothetical protein [Halomonas alkaliphila]